MGTPKSNSGDLARLQEANRQALIKSGLSQINSIYSGGTYGTGATDLWNPKNRDNLYTASGKSISGLDMNDPLFGSWLRDHPNLLKGVTQHASLGQRTAGHILFGPGGAPGDPLWGGLLGGDDPKKMSPDQLRNKYAQFLARSGQLFTGTTTSPGFNKDFYDKRATDYINYAMPELQQQAGQQSKQLQYKLANQGLTKSSAGQQLGSSLIQEINKQRQGVVSGGIQQAQDLQRNVEQNRSNLISQLELSADPGAASQQALSTAAGFRAPSQFQPLGSLFSNWANTYMASQVPRSGGMSMPYLYGMPNSTGSTSGIIPNNGFVR